MFPFWRQLLLNELWWKWASTDVNIVDMCRSIDLMTTRGKVLLPSVHFQWSVDVMNKQTQRSVVIDNRFIWLYVQWFLTAAQPGEGKGSTTLTSSSVHVTFRERSEAGGQVVKEDVFSDPSNKEGRKEWQDIWNDNWMKGKKIWTQKIIRRL